MVSRLFISPFVRGLTTLSVGTALARVIPIISSPLLTRLYSPVEFGLAAVFLALISAVTPAVCGKYEVALVLPKDGDDSARVLGIAIRVSVGLTIFIAVLFALSGGSLARLLRAEAVGLWLYVLPMAVLTTGIGTALSYFAIQREDFGNVARGQMINSATAAALGITLGYLGAGFGGLLMGWLAGSAVTATYFLFVYRSALRSEFLGWTEAHRNLAKRYADFPLYNAPSSLINGITAQLPTFFLNYFFPGSVVGHFSVLTRVVETPLSVLSTPFSQVNLKKVAELANRGIDARPYILKASLALAAVVLLPAILLVSVAPDLFEFVFGSEWRQAGVYLQILMPAFAIRFIASTLSTTIEATEHNRLAAVWRVVALLTTVSVYLAISPRGDAIGLFRAVVIMDASLYSLYYVFIWWAASKTINRVT